MGSDVRKARPWLRVLVFLALAAGCDRFTDAATRLAYDMEAGASVLGKEEGARYSIQHHTPSADWQCTGPYVIQFDSDRGLVIWCKDEAGNTVSSHSTSYADRFVHTPRQYILNKPAGSTLTIDIERRGGRAVVTDIR